MESYTQKLVNQYKMAKGEEKIDSEVFWNWVKERRKDGEEYIKLLDELNITYGTPEHIEVGKGSFDSIFLPYETRFLTQYTETFDKKNRTIKGSILVYESEPLIYQDCMPSKITSIGDIQKIMIENPFSCFEIDNWHEVHNGSNIEILIGMYGKISDKDKESKMRLLNHIKNQLKDDYIYEYQENNGNYFEIVASKPKIKTR